MAETNELLELVYKMIELLQKIDKSLNKLVKKEDAEEKRSQIRGFNPGGTD